MTQFYSDPSREADPHALPDAEAFYVSQKEIDANGDWADNYTGQGWYYWFCFPGCMPDSEVYGPFDTEADAIAHCHDTFME
jgi:hypothetical protein